MIKLILAFALSAYAIEDSKLVKSVHNGTVEEIKKLAQDPKELNWKDDGGFDALFYAVSLNDVEKIQVLLNAGALTQNLYSDKKESLLFEATRLGAEDAMEALLKKDPTLLKIKNINGESPVFEAVREDQSKVVRYFFKKGLSVKEKNKAGKTPADYVDPKNKKMVALFKELKLAK